MEERYVPRLDRAISPPHSQHLSHRLRLVELWKELPPTHRQAILSALVRLLASQASLTRTEVTHDNP